MPIFKCFYKIMRKNKTAILIYLALFTAMLVLFTDSDSSNDATGYADTRVPISVIDRDGTTLSRALSDYLFEHNDRVDLADDTETLQDALFFRNTEYILFIPEGFEREFLTGSGNFGLENVKLPKSTAGVYIDNRIDRYVSTANAYITAGYELTEALGLAAADLQIETSVKMSTGEAEVSSKTAYYYQFLAYILMALIISALGPILIAFNQTDIKKRTESSSMKLREYNIQLALGCIVFSCAIWLATVIVSVLLYGGEMFSAVSAMRVANSFVFLTVCVSITFLLGQFIKSTSALASITNVVALGMSFLCGVYVPQDLLGPSVLSVSKFLPVYWYVKNNDALTTSIGSGVPIGNPVYEGLAIQLAFAAAIFLIALVISRQKKVNSII